MEELINNIRNQIVIFNTKTELEHFINAIEISMQLVLLAMNIILRIIVQDNITSIFLWVFPISILIVSLISSYIRTKIKTKMQHLEYQIEFNTTGKVRRGIFEEIIKPLDLKKQYHICRECDIDGYIKEWTVFNKNMNIEDFFSDSNKPLLSSKNNTLTDLLIFVENNKKRRKNAKIGKRTKAINGKRAKTVLDK